MISVQSKQMTKMHEMAALNRVSAPCIGSEGSSFPPQSLPSFNPILRVNLPSPHIIP